MGQSRRVSVRLGSVRDSDAAEFVGLRVVDRIYCAPGEVLIPILAENRDEPRIVEKLPRQFTFCRPSELGVGALDRDSAQGRTVEPQAASERMIAELEGR